MPAGRRQEADGGPGQRWRGRRTGQQESETGVCCASPCACQEKGRGNGATADLAAQTFPPPPPLWLSGQLPPSQRGRGSGRQNPNQRGGGPVCAAVRLAVTVAPTRVREGRSEAASLAAGAAGRRFEPSLQQRTQSEFFLTEKYGIFQSSKTNKENCS